MAYDTINSRIVFLVNFVPVAIMNSTGFKALTVGSPILDIDGGAVMGNSILLSHPWTGDIPAVLAVTGTDTTPADGTTFVSDIIIPHQMTITGVSYLIGSVGGTNRVYAAIWDSAGVLLGNSTLASAGTVVGTTATMQALNLTSPIVVDGPARYYIGIAMNGNTARLRTHLFGRHRANSVAMTHGTIVALVPGTLFSTEFTASTGPYATVY
jgi:hypothetical protein